MVLLALDFQWRWVPVSPAQECGDCRPVLCQWYFIGPLGGTFKKGEEKEKGYLTGWQKIQLTWLEDKTTRNIHNVLLKVE